MIVAQPVPIPTAPRGAGWPPALRELAQQFDTGRVYDRDLPELVDALNVVLAALGRRPAVARRPRWCRLSGGLPRGWQAGCQPP